MFEGHVITGSVSSSTSLFKVYVLLSISESVVLVFTVANMESAEHWLIETSATMVKVADALAAI